jgi:hypothetical protein
LYSDLGVLGWHSCWSTCTKLAVALVRPSRSRIYQVLGTTCALRSCRRAVTWMHGLETSRIKCSVYALKSNFGET